ncbi:MAG: NAD(P)-dependent oxidoreductase [Alphaproteobacteria bacterium]
MAVGSNTNIRAGRLSAEKLEENFSDLHPPLDPHEALVASDRCYFCYDAPCVTACPTGIDIPLFIRQISTGMPEAAAKTIFDQNILGGMCARVCPTETLCEQACVRETAEGKPVEIGLLQRFATDELMSQDEHPYDRAADTGKKIAVVGAGPAGLACAHRLALHGNTVEIFDARPKGGGLNEFGIAAYKSVDDFAQDELDWLLEIGGISISYDQQLGDGLNLETLVGGYDAVFLGVGKTGVRALGLQGEDKQQVLNAVDFISELRQADKFANVAVGDSVLVIGGGMTAVDAAVQSKLLGAKEVTIAYRRDRSAMPASEFEQNLASLEGVRILENLQPKEILGNGVATGMRFDVCENKGGKLAPTGETVDVSADQIMKAIGQTLVADFGSLEIDQGAIVVDGEQKTSLANVWAGGDCATGGDDLTVTAVAEGRDAAENIHVCLNGKGN